MDPEVEFSTCLVATEEGTVELRATTPTADAPGFEGYSSTWWTVDDRGTFFIPGAFKKTFREAGKNAPVLWQHQAGGLFGGTPDVPIGKHISLAEDDQGARVNVAINQDVQRGAEVLSAMRFGSPVGLSFGFIRVKDRSGTEADKAKLNLKVAPTWVQSAPIEELRGIQEVRYLETSPVVFASNANAKPTSVRTSLGLSELELRGLIEAIKSGRLDEKRCGLVSDIVAAWEERQRAGAGATHSTRDDTARRRRQVEMEAVLMGLNVVGVGV